MNGKQIKQHVDKVLDICHGTIFGQMHQIFARTKYGDFDYTERVRY